MEEKENYEPEKDADLIRKSLKYDKLSVDEFDYYWKACSQTRLKDILESTSTAELLISWPEYKTPFGYRLIDIDFKIRFKNTPSILDIWDNTFEELLNIVKDGISNKEIKSSLEGILNADINKNGKDVLLMWTLHAYFIPFHRTVTKNGTGKNNVTRYSISDSQKSFLLVVKSCAELEDVIRFLKSRNEHIQPFIIGIGDDIKTI